MIKFGFNTLAMLTYGLGNAYTIGETLILPHRPKVEFVNKPLGIAVEQKGGHVEFGDAEVGFRESDVGFKSR